MRASQVVLAPKNLSANAAAGGQETQVWSLGWEDSLEEGMATHCIILAWRILTDREPGRVPMLWQRVRHDRATNTFTFQKENCWIIW